MRFLVVVCDGAADYLLKELGSKTPLQVASKPNIDGIAAKSRMGLLETLPSSMPTGSTIANLSILGYDPVKCFEGRKIEGRGFFEAMSLGLKLDSSDVAFRCNLINIKDGKINSHSSGNISSRESRQLIQFIDKELGSDEIKFYPGLSYRHIMLVKNASLDIECAPPHDHVDEDFSGLMVKPLEEEANGTAELLNKLILDSMEILPSHPINVKREAEGKPAANSIWPWSQGNGPNMPKFKEMFGLSGAAVAAVDLIQGLAKTAGFDVIKVKGATGLWNTNYEGKANAAIKALQNHDFAFVHVEAADEASHEGNVNLKIKVIEDIDKRLFGTILNGLPTVGDDVAIAMLPDHLTPVKQRIHVRGNVPFMIYNPNSTSDGLSSFDEETAKSGSFGLLKGKQFIEAFLEKK